VSAFNQAVAPWGQNIMRQMFSEAVLWEIPEWHLLIGSTYVDRGEDKVEVAAEEAERIRMMIGVFLSGLEEKWGDEEG
jgi:hypothetical protein